MNTRQLFLKHIAQTSDKPLMLEVDRAEGIHIFDREGKEYIDLIAGIGVSNVGHRHPKVVRAIKDQIDRYLHTMVYGEFIQTPQVLLAKALIQTLANSFESVYFVNSGSEAIEGALKLAKRYTGRSEIISFKNGYHGSSHGALSATGSEEFKRNFRPLIPAFRHLDFNNEDHLDQMSNKTAAVLIELIQGEGGVILGNPDYISKISARCKDMGILLMVDEIQTGFGRTGKFWAHEHYDITPDVVISAKGMGGGMPIGCFIASREIMNVFTNNPILGHITTFGGHPVSCAASLACLKVIQDEKLFDSVDEKAAIFINTLKHPEIKEIRNKGLMMAVEFESHERLKSIIDSVLEMGIITDWFLFNDKSMRIAPPLTISVKEIKKACELILRAIG